MSISLQLFDNNGIFAFCQNIYNTLNVTYFFMKRFIFVSALLQLLCFSVVGQTFKQDIKQTTSGFKRCGTTEFMEKQMSENPDYRLRQEQLSEKRHAIGSVAHKQLLCATTYEIPVAIHFDAGIGTTAAERECLRYLVSSQMEVLNDAYSGGSLSEGSDACIRFVLGNSNHPAGSVMYPGGPVLVNGDPAITYNGEYTCQSGSPCDINTWNGYMNIAVQTGTGVLGVAFLGATFTSGNTLTIEACAFGTYAACSEAGPALCGGSWTYDGGMTAVHEIGHFLNLEHVFCNDSGSGYNSCDGSGIVGGVPCSSADNCDGIADTPAQCESVYSCSATNNNPCTGVAGDPISFPNFMDYGDDGCMNLFTDGQIAVMNSHLSTIIGGARPNINNAPCPNILNGTLTKTGTSPVCSGTAIDACVQVDLINDANAIVEFSDDAGTTFASGTLTPRPTITVHTITLNPLANYGMPAGPIYEGDVVLIPATAAHPVRTDNAAGGFPSGATEFGFNAGTGFAPLTTNLSYAVLVPGTYHIECANHPGSMNGSFTVIPRPNATYCKTFTETNTTCSTQSKTFHARWNAASQDSDCSLDTQTTNSAGTLTTTVYPAPQAPTAASIVTNACVVTVTPACAGSLGAATSPNGTGVEIADWDATTGTYTADPNDAAGSITITVNGVSGAPVGCVSTTFSLTTPACSALPTFTSVVSISDPCVCKNDASTLVVAANGTVTDLNGVGTGNSDGTFDDVITATYDADNGTAGTQYDANIDYRVVSVGPNIVGGTAPIGIAVGNILMDNSDGTYEISFSHTSGVGYTATIEAFYSTDPDGAGPIAVGDAVPNTSQVLNPTPCQYPEVVFSAMPTTLNACTGSALNLLNLTNPDTDITFGGANVSGTTFDAAAAGVSTGNNISVTVNPADATPPTSQDGQCLQPYALAINVIACPPCAASTNMLWND